MSAAALDGLRGVRLQLLASAGVLVALAIPALVGLAVDERTIAGVSVWDKPIKFDFAFGLHLATLWVLAKHLAGPLPAGAMRGLRWSVVAVAACALAEALYITLQAARGRASHFNRETPLETFLYFGAMGPAAVVILAGTFGVGWILWRHGRRDAGAGLRWGAGLGLMLGSAATLVAAAPLSAGFVDGLGHWVGGERTDAHGMALTGWATRGGDLRVPHFFATHLMQALPLAGWLGDRVAPARAVAGVNVAAAVGVAMVGLTMWQAVTGRPFLP